MKITRTMTWNETLNRYDWQQAVPLDSRYAKMPLPILSEDSPSKRWAIWTEQLLTTIRLSRSIQSTSSHKAYREKHYQDVGNSLTCRAIFLKQGVAAISLGSQAKD
jgi:hypothetical protein